MDKVTKGVVVGRGEDKRREGKGGEGKEGKERKSPEEDRIWN